MRALVDALDEPTLIVEGLTVALANDAAHDLFGKSVEGRDIRLVIRHPAALDHILNARTADIEATGIGGFGRPWQLSVRDVGSGAVLIRMIDRSEAVAAEKMRVDFVANASHELRTPLSTILGYAETLAEEQGLPADMPPKVGATVRDEARRMLRIIEDLMSLSRIEADRFIAPTEEVDLAELVSAAIASAGHLRGAAGCEFAVDLPSELPPVRGDAGQLAQVLDNILGNAVRYGCDRSDSKIELTVRPDGGWVVLSIRDHGPGIPREHLPRLTERFYRVDPARSRESGGTGLGLAIVKHIVERHRGLLEIKSTLGIGTTVTIRLPAAR